MEPVRLGIIGCGVIGRVHLQAAAEVPMVKVVAVADLRSEAAQAAAKEFGVRSVYEAGTALLEDRDVEAVILAMPARGRAELAIRAFENGKHVLTEKPVAMNADEVRRMIAARGKLVGACCSSRYRFLPSAQAATEFAASGALGRLRAVHCRVLRSAGPAPKSPPPPWRLKKALNGGGILMNWGCYDMDYLFGITGWSLKPRLVLAQTWTVPPAFEPNIAPGSDAETHFAAFVRCEGDTVITFERGEYMTSQNEDSWQLIGDKGALHLTMSVAAGKKLVYTEASTQQGVISKTLWEGNEDHSFMRVGLLQDFARAIREGGQPKTNLEQSLMLQTLFDAIYASAEQGRAVEINL